MVETTKIIKNIGIAFVQIFLTLFSSQVDHRLLQISEFICANSNVPRVELYSRIETTSQISANNRLLLPCIPEGHCLNLYLVMLNQYLVFCQEKGMVDQV